MESGRTGGTNADDSPSFIEPDSLQKYSDAVRELIAKKAAELYEQRGRQPGRDLDDWLEAEAIVLSEFYKPRQ